MRTLLLAFSTLLLITLVGGVAQAQTTSEVVWKAGAESTVDKEWAELSTHTNCARTTYAGITDGRITRVSSPRVRGNYAYRFYLRNGDSCYGERAEVGQDNPPRSDMLNRRFYEGQERWISFQTRLGSDFPLDPNTWQVVMQLKQQGSWGSPVMALDVDNNQWEMNRTSNNPNNQWPAGFDRDWNLGPARTGVWTKFTWHVKFSPNPNVGFLEIYGDLGDGRGMRQLFSKRYMSTMKVNPNTGATLPSHARIGIYRDPNISGNATAYFDGFTVATTRAAAQATAFGG